MDFFFCRQRTRATGRNWARIARETRWLWAANPLLLDAHSPRTPSPEATHHHSPCGPQKTLQHPATHCNTPQHTANLRAYFPETTHQSSTCGTASPRATCVTCATCVGSGWRGGYNENVQQTVDTLYPRFNVDSNSLKNALVEPLPMTPTPCTHTDCEPGYYLYSCVGICVYIYIYIYIDIHTYVYQYVYDDDAFITVRSSLVPLIEGLCAQIYFRFEISVVCIHIFYFSFSEEKIC